MSIILKRYVALFAALCLTVALLPMNALATDTQPLNVMDFGAVGDGTAGDHAAIQAAIDSAAEGSSGGVVTFPAGTYLADDFIILKSNVTLQLDDEAVIVNGINYSSGPSIGFLTGPYTRGQAKQLWEGVENVTVTGGTIDMNGVLNADGTGAENLPLVSSTGAFALGYSTNVHIENVTFRNNYAGHTIRICACDGVTITGCSFEGQTFADTMSDELKKSRETVQVLASSANGFPYATNDTGEAAQNITVENCVFGASDQCAAPYVGIGNHSLISSEQKCSGIIARSNTFADLGYLGVRFRGFENVTVQGNSFTGGYKGIELESCSGSITMDGNTFSGGEYQNVRLLGCGDNGTIYFYTHGPGAVDVSTADDTYTFTATPSAECSFVGYYKQNALTDLVTTDAVITFPVNKSANVFRHPLFESCSHNYTTTGTDSTCTESGYVTYTCQLCGYSYTVDLGTTDHTYAKGVCTDCGAADPDHVDYYLIGYINGADHGCEGDYANPGDYKFEDYELTVTFTSPSYVFVKTGDNANWYMSEGYCTASSVTLYNTAGYLEDPNKLFVPGGVEVTFTLTVNSNDTLTLSYEKGVCEHEYNAVVTAPTCTADGYTTYTCTKCGEGYVDDIVLSTGHSYVDNVCSICGRDAVDDETPVGNLFTLAGANMVLGGELDMNFFISPDNLTGTDYYAVITLYTQDETITTTISYADWEVRTGYMVVTQKGLAARQMADRIEVVVYHGTGIQASVLWADSVRAYAMRILEKQNDEAKTLLVDMLNYGAAAQSYFGYNTEDLANNQLSEAQQAYATQTVSGTDQRVKGENYYGSSLTLKNRIMLTMYFSNINTDMYALVCFTDHKGNIHETYVEGSSFSQHNDNVYGVVADELVVADGDQLGTVYVYDAEGNLVGMASDTVNSYASRQTGSDSLFEMVQKFTAAAYAYFH